MVINPSEKQENIDQKPELKVVAFLKALNRSERNWHDVSTNSDLINRVIETSSNSSINSTSNAISDKENIM